jgi:outer membrane protein assembly factor BamE (lipoprotein component of BamABCDE complex)
VLQWPHGVHAVREEFKMTMSGSKIAILALVAAAGVASGGCSRVVGHQGFIADDQLIAGIQPGIDTKSSVEKTLGRPSFVGQFAANEWFYVARSTKQLAFATPSPTKQTILRVKFDPSGNVVAVDRQGMEQIASISPVGDKTPTLGRERGFFEDIFGNIGAVGAASQSGGTADNPN